MAMLSMNELTTFRWSFEEDVHQYAAAGIPAIGVWRQKLADYGQQRGIELLKHCGMKVSNLLWAGGFTGSDGRTFRESLLDASEAIRQAADLKAGALVTHSGSRSLHTLNHARRLFIDALKELTPIAAEHGVTLAIEPMHTTSGAEWTFLDGIDKALRVIEDVASPKIKLVFDTYHLCQDGDALSRIEEIAPHVAVVHLGDNKRPPSPDQDRSPLCTGTVPLREIVQAFASAGYEGYYDVELMGEEIEASDYEQLLVQSKQAFEAIAGV